MEGLETELKSTQKALNNLIRAIEHGIFSESTQERLSALEARKKALNEAIEAETVKRGLTRDENSIKAYFDQYAHAVFGNPEVREMLLDYFIDKIYVFDDHLEIPAGFQTTKLKLSGRN